MKKLVAVFIALYFISMGTMVVWGFIDKQNKEKILESTGTGSDGINQQQKKSDKTTTQPDSSNQQTASYPNQTSSSPPNNSQSTTNGGSTTIPTGISMADVAKHKTAQDCWLVINGNVYDITKYIDLHPGGADLILMECGKDATQAYNTQGGRGRGHSARADRELANFLVGKLSN